MTLSGLPCCSLPPTCMDLAWGSGSGTEACMAQGGGELGAFQVAGVRGSEEPVEGKGKARVGRGCQLCLRAGPLGCGQWGAFKGAK